MAGMVSACRVGSLLKMEMRKCGANRMTAQIVRVYPMEYDYIKKSRDKFMEKYKLDKYYNDFASIIMR